MSLNIVNSFKLTPPPPGIVGGWVELARTTLGAANATINVPSIADKRYYMILCDSIGTTSGTGAATMQFNADTANNYSRRDSQNGGADTTATGASSISTFGTGTQGMFQVGYLANLSAKEKLIQWFLVHTGDSPAASNFPFRQEGVGKHAQTSSPFDEFDWKTGGSTFLTGSEVVILGWDPTDTHTDNFWEELVSVDLSGGAATSLSTGTFTAKKYLWVQIFAEPTTSGNPLFRVGNGTVDSGSNYAGRTSANGGSDATDANQPAIQNFLRGTANTSTFVNMFIVNNASNVKLMIYHNIQQVASGSAQAPDRRESVWKWANTSNQINIMELFDTGNLATKTQIKVWGSD